MRRVVKEVVKGLDLQSWDSWLPLAIIAAFGAWAVLVGLGVVNFPSAGNTDRIRAIYSNIGLGTARSILPITVTLSLVAIQFASQQYSHRIMAFYIKSVMLWSVIIVYLAVIVAAILLEVTITESPNPRLAGVVVVCTLMALALLVPHFVVIAAFLRPEFIIGKLLRRVDTDYLMSIERPLADSQGRLDSQMDRLLPVVEIVERAIDRGDISTTRAATAQLHKTYMTQAEDLNSPSVEQYFLDYLLRIGRKAVSAPNAEEAAVQAVQLIGTVGAQGPAGAIATGDIRSLGFAALKRDAEAVVHQMMDSLLQLFERTELAEAKKAVLDIYHDLVENLAATEKRRLLRHLATNLSKIAQASLAQRDLAIGNRCLDLLESVGHDSGTHNLVDVVLHVVELLRALGVAAAQEETETAERIVRTVLRIERAISTKEREAIAATEFAKGEIERVLSRRGARATPAAQVPAKAPQQAQEMEGDAGFSDLWGKPKE